MLAMPNIEVITLIYKSVDYLEFIAQQLNRDLCQAGGWKVGIRVVANDATEEVIDRLPALGIPYTIFDNPDPNEFYLNRVYRAYNFCVQTSTYDNVCLLNSDNVMSKDWLTNLLKHHNGTNIPCSRMVESGKMGSGAYGINLGINDFGRHPRGFDFDGWEEFAKTAKIDKAALGGMYGGCVFERERFLESGGYAEGNVFPDGVGTLNGPVIKTGDQYLFELLESKYGMKHITIFDSLLYHIIEGEKDT